MDRIKGGRIIKNIIIAYRIRADRFIADTIRSNRVEVVKVSLDLTGKILILIKEDLESWMSATERSTTPLYTE